ncbi:hypothetical protein CHUAL_003249 [Chamberlinius hualienensis]
MASWKSSEKSLNEYLRPKQSLHRLESSINKCTNIVIPLHLDLLRKHAGNIKKYQQLKEWSKVRQEQINATRTVEQLKADLWSLDLLRNQVIDDDLAAFNKIAEKSQAAVSAMIQEFLAIANETKSVIETENTETESSVIDEPNDSSCQNLKLAFAPIESEQSLRQSIEEQSIAAQSWEELADNLQDLNETVITLSTLVHHQQEVVSRIEDNIESADHRVYEGTKQLAKARKYKTAIIPVAGAIVGGCIGGPVGMFAGLKVGAAAVALGGLIGFTSGRLFKKKIDRGVAIEMYNLDQLRLEYKTHSKSCSLPDMRIVCYENVDGFMNVTTVQKS